MSGRNDCMIASNQASSASTVSATFCARPLVAAMLVQTDGEYRLELFFLRRRLGIHAGYGLDPNDVVLDFLDARNVLGCDAQRLALPLVGKGAGKPHDPVSHGDVDPGHRRPWLPFQIDEKHGTKDVDESSDMYDTVEWLLHNVPNNNGKVGIWGVSYPGFYTSASIIDSHPALKAASPQAPMTDLFMGDDSYHGGAFMLNATFGFYSAFRPPANPSPPVPLHHGFPPLGFFGQADRLRADPVPEFRDYHRRMWAGEVDLADKDVKAVYGRVHWERLLQNVRQARYHEALRIVSDRPATNARPSY